MRTFLLKQARLIAFLILCGTSAGAQTTLINSAGDGGFETGADFAANGWQVANGTVTNKWFLGTVPAGFTNKAAYISNDAAGANWTYTVGSISVVHFYRDVTFPAGQTDVTLSFNWAAAGESGSFDALMVSLAPTTYTPTATNTSLSTNGLAAPATTIATLWSSPTVQTASIKIPRAVVGNCSAATTLRLIFTWKNDGSGGSQPPAAIDNISLVTQAVAPGRITAAGGTFTINPALANTGTNFTTFTEAVNALNSATCGVFTSSVTFNVAANQTFNEIVPPITASSSATAPIVFQKAGTGANPIVTRSDAGTFTTSTMGGQGDGVIIIDGGDYITFDKIDVTATDQGIEYGYYLRKAAGTDGCKNLTIRNAAVTMTRGTSVYVTGIYASNLDATSPVNSASGVTVTSTGGRSENITITGNTISNVFYGIQMRGFAAATPYDLYDQNNVIGATGAGNGNTINNFGGTSTTAVYGIYLNNQNNVSANFNTVNNTDNGGVNSTGTMYGIYMSTGTNSVFTANNNNISLTGAYTSGSLYGVYNSSGTGNMVANNNTISLSNTSSSSGTIGFIYNGSATAATAVSFNNNTFSTNGLTSTGTVYLIYNSVTNAALTTIQNNATSGTLSVTGSAAFYCYYNGSSPTGTDIFSGNNFSNITVGSSFYGYYTSTASSHKRDAFNNTFSTIVAGGGTMYGIYKGSGNSNIYNNKIADFTSNATSSSVYGIYIASGTKDSVYNNIIGDLKAPSASTASNAVVGIYLGSTTATSTIGVYFNTVYLSASSGGANFGTSAIYATGSATATSGALEMKNNIFINNSQPNGTGYAAVYRRSSTSLANYVSSSNNNLFYTTSPGGNTVIFYDGTNSDVSLTDFKNRVAPRETNSVSENPPFVSTTPTDATYLHISTTTPTQVESGGVPVGGITTDIDGNTRNTTNPDMGADEFAGLSADLTGPNISYTPLSAACSAGDKILSGVIITDATGVPTTGALVPRIYYQKNGGTWFSKPGTLTTGTATNGTWSFTIAAADLGTLTTGDIISYYVIAQDVVATPNVASNPGGVVATNVNSISAHPTTPNTYIVGASLNGTYTVGGAGNFNSLTKAVSLYNSCPVAGPVIFNLTDPLYNESTETFPITINANSAASSTNTLLIKPAAGMAISISGTTGAVTPTSIIRLDGADYVTIDGLNTGGASLSVENTSTLAGTAAIWLSSGGAGLGATHNTIRKVDIKGGITQNNSANNTYGIVIAGNSLNSTIGSIPAGDDNDSNVLDSNTFSKLRYGIYTRGGSTTNPNLGTVITRNIIGPTSFGSDEIGRGGIVVREEDGIVISQNEVRFVGGDYNNTSGGADRVGISLEQDALWPVTSAYVKNAIVTRNLIHDIVEERTFAAVGIAIGGVDGTNTTNNLVSNNMIYNILANGTGADQGTGIGTGSGKGDRIVYNSIYMTGDADPTAASTVQATSAFGINVGATAVADISILNNVVWMDLTASRATSVKNACIAIPASYTWGAGVMNYNDWYINSGNSQAYIGAVGGSGGTYYSTLASWQTATTKDANSLSVDPLFVSQADLHLQPASPLDLQAIPVAGVTVDYDGQTRDASVPDMGADEINLNSCTGAVGGTIVAANTTRCATDSTTITASGFSIGSGSGYQWQSSPDNTNWTDVAGSTSPVLFNTHGLAATTYYRLKVTCPSGTAVAYSNVVTITVNPIPTVTITPAGPIVLCAPATQTLSLSATSATSPTYQWQQNGTDIGGANATSYVVNASGSYRLKVTQTTTGCSNTSAAVNVTVNPQPSAVSVTPSSVTMCSATDAAVLLTASGGTIPGQMVFGTQANQNAASTTATGYPAPFSNYYGGNRHQFLVLASELSAAGFSAGSSINGINFPVASLGSTFTNNQNFKIKVGHTTLTSLTAFVAGLATTYGPATVTPTVGYNNQIDFSTPFVWNGTDNLIIETTYSNANTGGSTDLVVMYNTPTAFASTVVYRVDASSAATVEASTTVSYSYSARPDFTLTGNLPTAVTWAPTAGLYTNAAATTAYTGTATNTVYAKPAATATYTATAKSSLNCTNSQTVTITQNCVVPISLVSFKGERAGAINKLEWTTATEINNAGFELQRGVDGRNFTSLAYVASKAANGNSTASLSYGFDDVKPLSGNGYYRLKQIDKDGKASFSQVVLIKGGKLNAITIASIYPNPVAETLNMLLASPTNETITLVVTDLSGKVVKQQTAKVAIGDNQLQVQVSNLASGTYLVKAMCTNGCETAVQKFVKD